MLLGLLPEAIGGGDGTAFEFLTPENMRIFNEMTPNDPDVKYFSWGAWYEPPLVDILRYELFLYIITSELDDSDSFV
jgi:triacylglycerol lipase